MLHRSMRGTPVDMTKLQRRHENSVAVGNAQMNARGDIVGRGGRVVQRVEERTAPLEKKESPADIRQPSTIDPRFFETSQVKNYDEVDFKTPAEVMQETQKWSRENQARRSETPPQVRTQRGHVGKKPSANAPDVVDEGDAAKSSRRRSTKKEDTNDS